MTTIRLDIIGTIDTPSFDFVYRMDDVDAIPVIANASPPGEGYCRTLAVNPAKGIVMANTFPAGDDGLYVSFDAGHNFTFQPLSSVPWTSNNEFSGLGYMDGVFANVMHDGAWGVFRTNINGTNWVKSNSVALPVNMTNGTSHPLYYWPTSGLWYCYVGSGGVGSPAVFTSGDQGATWVGITSTEIVNFQFNDPWDKKVASSPTALLIPSNSTTGGIWRTTSTASNPTLTESAVDGQFLNGLVYGNNVFIGVSNTKVWRSTDDGLTWVDTGLSGHQDVTYEPVTDTFILVANTGTQIRYSSDQGASWTLRSNVKAEGNNLGVTLVAFKSCTKAVSYNDTVRVKVI